MKQSWSAGLTSLSCLTLLAAPVFARAMMIAPAPLSQRAALADAIVVGKVTGFGDKLVSAVPPGGAAKVDYPIAVVQVADAVSGLKDAKEIRVGFIPPQAPPTPAPGPGPVLLVKRYPQFNLTLDQEACLFLVKHPTEDFYVGLNYYDVVDKKAGDFDKSLDEVKRCVKLLADPMASLKAKEADDRTLTAEMLVARYRMARGPGEPKTEDVGAEESKLILQTLADADWSPKLVAGPGGFQMSPQMSFFQLGLTEKDGWKPPQDGKELEAAAKKWLKDNADKYRVQKFVADKKEDKKEEKKDK